MGRAVPMSLALCGFAAHHGSGDVTRFWVDLQPI